MTQRVDNPGNINVIVANALPLVVQGDPAGVPIPVSGASGYTPPLLSASQILKTGVSVSSATFADKFVVRNNGRVGVPTPIVLIHTSHNNTGRTLKCRFKLYMSLLRYGQANSWGYADMKVDAGSGEKMSYIGASVPAMPSVDDDVDPHLEDLGWEIAVVQLAWDSASSYSVDIDVFANFEIALVP